MKLSTDVAHYCISSVFLLNELIVILSKIHCFRWQQLPFNALAKFPVKVHCWTLAMQRHHRRKTLLKIMRLTER